MLTLREVMTTDLISVTPDMSVRDAMNLLASRHISGAPVLESGRIVGIVSTTDLLLLATALPSAPARARSRLPDDALEDRSRRAEVPVPLDVVVDTWNQRRADALLAESEEDDEGPEGPEWSPIDEHTVAEAMSTSVLSLAPETDVRVAGALMARERVHRVLVVSGTTLVGIVTALDLAKAVADHRVRTETYAFPHRGPRDNRQADDSDLQP